MNKLALIRKNFKICLELITKNTSKAINYQNNLNIINIVHSNTPGRLLEKSRH